MSDPDSDEPLELAITDVIDLHSFPPREVGDVVRSWLDAAWEAGLRELRIIHGRGIGAQRRTVRTILERDPRVLSFADAPPEAGGWGATCVSLGETGAPPEERATAPPPDGGRADKPPAAAAPPTRPQEDAPATISPGPARPEKPPSAAPAAASRPGDKRPDTSRAAAPRTETRASAPARPATAGGAAPDAAPARRAGRRSATPPAAPRESPLRRRLRRAWHRLRLAVRPRNLELVYSSTYKLEIGGLPIDTDRAEKILTFLDLEGLLARDRLLRPKRASLADLRRVHDDDYLDSLRHAEALTPIVGVEVWDELHQRALAAQRSAVGGTVLAARRALERRGTTVNLGGGFHHAEPGAGRGFCIFNDVAVAIALARADGFDQPVLVVDLDLHDGNGTRRAFADDPTVFTFSIHNQSWDEEPATASLSLELGDDVEDDAYLAAVREHLPRLLDEHRPGLVFYLAGTDPAADDRIGNWKISAAGLLRRDRYVLSRMKRHGRRIPTVMVMAGGYGHLAWRYTARTLAWLLTDRRDFPIPSNEAITYARYRGLVADLEGERRGKRSTDDLWELTEEDVLGGLGAEARPTRLLGHFSRHHIELVLERTGFLESLRGMGFPHPTMELDLDNPAGQTVRVFSDSDRDELLMELRLRLDRRSLTGRRLVKLEWLLLQNPRLSFDARQAALPGQSHPGLGLLNDVIALLLLMCRDMELDGIVFVPSHYHLAAKGRKYLRFLEPADEAWIRAIERAVGHLPLAAATRAVADGRLVDEAAGEPVAWRPMLMVIPTSTALTRRLEAPEYQREVDQAGAGLRFALAPTGATAAG